MTQEALKLALEALEGSIAITMPKIALRNKAITAIKEALREHAMREVQRLGQEIEQEPVAFVKGCNRGQWEIFPAKAHQIFGIEQPLYTTPPQRKPLTDEQIEQLEQDTCAMEFPETVRAIEAAHGIKE